MLFNGLVAMRADSTKQETQMQCTKIQRYHFFNEGTSIPHHNNSAPSQGTVPGKKKKINTFAKSWDTWDREPSRMGATNPEEKGGVPTPLLHTAHRMFLM